MFQQTITGWGNPQPDLNTYSFGNIPYVDCLDIFSNFVLMVIRYWLYLMIKRIRFRRQFQLNLAVKSSKFAFQLLQFIFLLPNFSGQFLQLRNIFCQRFVFLFPLGYYTRYLLQRIEEVGSSRLVLQLRSIIRFFTAQTFSFRYEWRVIQKRSRSLD